MNTIMAIDAILKNVIVRWALLALAAMLTAAGVWLEISNKTLKFKLNAANGQNAEYAARLSVQNEAIKKAGYDKQTMQLQAQAASAHVAELQAKLKKRKVEIREVVLQGPCEDMVQLVIDEVRK